MVMKTWKKDLVGQQVKFEKEFCASILQVSLQLSDSVYELCVIVSSDKGKHYVILYFPIGHIQLSNCKDNPFCWDGFAFGVYVW